MKHAANRNKNVRPPRKGFSPSKIVAVKPRQKTSASPVKSTAVKTAAASIVRNTKTKNGTLAGRNEAKLLKNDLSKKVNSVAGKAARKSSETNARPAAKKAVLKIVGKPKTAVKMSDTKTSKTKTTIVVRKNPSVKNSAEKVKRKAAVKIEKPVQKPTAKISTAKSVKAVASPKTKASKILPAKSKIPTAKISRAKVEKPFKNYKIVGTTKKTNSVGKTSTAPKKVVPTVVASRKTTILPEKKLTAQEVNRKKNRVKTPILVENERTPKKLKPFEIKSLAVKKPTTKIAALPKNIKTAMLLKRKIEKPREVSANRKVAPNEKVKAAETPVEVVNAPPAKLKKKKVKPLGAAIFRGAKERYDFQVFPVDGEFEDAAAIFIISRRVVDKTKRAHHRMVCIGQTASVLGELKKHRKGKCFKQFRANAISFLREENEQKRMKIEADLKSAHTIPCPHS